MKSNYDDKNFSVNEYSAQGASTFSEHHLLLTQNDINSMVTQLNEYYADQFKNNKQFSINYIDQSYINTLKEILIPLTVPGKNYNNRLKTTLDVLIIKSKKGYKNLVKNTITLIKSQLNQNPNNLLEKDIKLVITQLTKDFHDQLLKNSDAINSHAIAYTLMQTLAFSQKEDIIIYSKDSNPKASFKEYSITCRNRDDFECIKENRIFELSKVTKTKQKEPTQKILPGNSMFKNNYSTNINTESFKTNMNQKNCVRC